MGGELRRSKVVRGNTQQWGGGDIYKSQARGSYMGETPPPTPLDLCVPVCAEQALLYILNIMRHATGPYALYSSLACAFDTSVMSAPTSLAILRASWLALNACLRASPGCRPMLTSTVLCSPNS